jgi:hypothetical protein
MRQEKTPTIKEGLTATLCGLFVGCLAVLFIVAIIAVAVRYTDNNREKSERICFENTKNESCFSILRNNNKDKRYE